MYCKKCKNLLPENEFICDKCRFDNAFKPNVNNDFTRKKRTSRSNNNSFLSVVVLFCILVISVIIIYSIKESKAIESNNITSISLPNTTSNNKKNNFIFDDLKLTYPSIFGNSTNTIFYKNNTDINITINTITNELYNDIINSNDCLDATINKINTKTYAGELFYSYIFYIDEKFYEIKVNYINDLNIYNEQLQNEISKIINSLVLNK